MWFKVKFNKPEADQPTDIDVTSFIMGASIGALAVAGIATVARVARIEKILMMK